MIIIKAIIIIVSCVLLLMIKIFDGFTKIESLLPGLAGGNEFGFGGRQRDIRRLDGGSFER